MKLKVAKVVGLNSDQEAAVVSSFGDEENILVIVLNLICDDAFGRGRQLMSDLSDIYFAAEENLPGKLTTIFNEAKERLADTEQRSILLGSVSGKVLYLIGEGNVKVILKRLDKSSIILDQANGRLVSGFLQESDRIFFATNNLVNLLSHNSSNHLDLPLTQWEDEAKTLVSGDNMSPEDINEPLATAGAVVDIAPDEEMIIPRANDSEKAALTPYQPAKPQELSTPLKDTVSEMILTLINKFSLDGRFKLVLAAAIIVVILVGGGLKFKSVKDAQNKQQFNQYMQAASDDFNAAQNLKTLNPVDAETKLKEAKDNIGKALKIDSKNQQALDLQKQINGSSNEVAQSAEANFIQYLSLDLIKKGFSAQKMSLSGNNLMLLGFDNTLVTVDLKKKSNQTLADKSKLGQANLASIGDTAVVVYSGDKGVLKVDLGNKSVQLISKPDPKWKEIDDLAFFSGNVYLLDAKANQIWKYLPTSNGYSDPRNYFSDKTTPNLSGALKMQIESSVYVLKSSGEILRFTKGESDSFSYSGLDKNVKNPKSLFTSSDTDNLYLLDSGNSRLLVLNKGGAYISQYIGDKFAAASDIVVSEEDKKVYLLDNNTIYTIELK